MNQPDYKELAKELLVTRAKLVRSLPHRKLSNAMRGELYVVNYLAAQEHNVHPKELSEAMSVSTARIANLLNQLEKKGLIQRHVDPKDNRQLIVVLTEEGIQQGKQLHADLHSAISEMLEILGPEDAQAYLRIQKKFLEHFQA